jgi:hypothetical protein
MEIVDKLMRYRPKRNVLNVIPGHAKREPGISSFRIWSLRTIPDDGVRSSLQLFVGDDFDAETGKSLVIVHRGREVDDRGDAEIAQDLSTDADFTPLPVTIGLRGFLFAPAR